MFSAFLVALSSMFWRLLFSRLVENRLWVTFCQFQHFRGSPSNLSSNFAFTNPSDICQRPFNVAVSALAIAQLILVFTADIHFFNTRYFQFLKKHQNVKSFQIFSSSFSDPSQSIDWMISSCSKIVDGCRSWWCPRRWLWIKRVDICQLGWN